MGRGSERKKSPAGHASGDSIEIPKTDVPIVKETNVVIEGNGHARCASGDTIEIPKTRIPVVKEADVVVIGAGPAGIIDTNHA